MREIADPSKRRSLEIVLVLLVAVAGLLSAGCAGETTAQDAQTAADEAATAETVAEVPVADPLTYPEWETVPAGEHTAYNQRANLVQRGHIVYQKYCLGCHGEYGDGDGPATVRLITKPRDFTSGIYKFRSTDSGSLPLDEDLHRTLTRGLSRVSMPAFRLMTEGDKLAVIEYVKTFYSKWETEKSRRRVVYIPSPPEDLRTQERVLRGRAVYLQMQCWKCHGTDGRGTGATQTEYVDAWGELQKPFDFTRGSLKGGNSATDIYRTFHTGLRSIMPAYEGEALAAVTAVDFDAMGADPQETARLEAVRDQFPADGNAIFSDMSEPERLELAERNSWDLVSYILSLRSHGTTAEAVVGKSSRADG